MKTPLRFWFALFFAKCTQGFMYLLHRNATYFPGKLALKLCPDFLKYIARPEKIIAVTGTNGKTTVANLLVDIFTARGETVVDNRLGSNIAAGIASSLISSAAFSNKCKASVGVLEVDERSSIRVYPYITPDYVIVTNLFRDSINRNAHPFFISGFINDYVPAASKLILNGDDLISGGIAPDNARSYFGVDLLPGETGTYEGRMNDLQICPHCHARLTYDWVHYHHMGRAHCPECGLKSPECSCRVTGIADGMMTMQVNGTACSIKAPGPNLSDIYNGAAAVALLSEMGMSTEEIVKAMGGVEVMKSRHNDAKAKNGIPIIAHMAKDLNAIACSRAFDYVRQQPGKKEVIIMMYNRELVAGSSENIAWIFDSDFEFLNDENITRLIIAGPRSFDFKLRLLMAGVPEEKLVCVAHEKYSPPHLLCEADESIYILYGTDSIREAMELQESIVNHINGEAAK